MKNENEPALIMSNGDLLPCGIMIDKEGDWYYRDQRMHRADIVAHLCQNMCWDESSGLYIIQIGKQRCYLEVEDTSLVITSVLHQKKRERDDQEQLLLSIKHLDVSEPLDPTSLWIGSENVLYCRVRKEKVPARFLRPAYYQMAKFIHEDQEQNRFYLFFRGKQYYID